MNNINSIYSMNNYYLPVFKSNEVNNSVVKKPINSDISMNGINALSNYNLAFVNKKSDFKLSLAEPFKYTMYENPLTSVTDFNNGVSIRTSYDSKTFAPMDNTIGNDGGKSYSQEYLNDIKNETLTRMDKAGNGDDKVTVNEALQDLNIGSLLDEQNAEDTAKIKAAAQNIEQVLTKYAGADGEFNAQEWAEFLNGDEWGAVLNAWHSSGQKAQLEMKWTDNAHIRDNMMTKDEVKVGILNNLTYNQNKYGMNVPTDTTEIEALIDKYAGPDGTFAFEEYRQMKNDPVYKQFVEQYNVVPWFKPFGFSQDNVQL